MRIKLVIAAMIVFGGVASASPPKKAISKPKPAAAVPSPACNRLTNEYDDISKALASNAAQGVGDNSAVRASMRESQDNNSLTKARMTLDLMKASNCPMPNYVPSARRYFSAALKCRTDTLNAETAYLRGEQLRTPPSCTSLVWQPDE